MPSGVQRSSAACTYWGSLWVALPTSTVVFTKLAPVQEDTRDGAQTAASAAKGM